MTETYKCALCGRESDTLEAGAWTDLTMHPLCHNDERSCYEAWTRDKQRPLSKTTVGDGETTVGSRFLDDLSIETLGHGSLAVSQESTESGTGVTRHALQNESQTIEVQGHHLEAVITDLYHLPECPTSDPDLCDIYPCRCDHIAKDYQELHDELEFQSLREETA